METSGKTAMVNQLLTFVKANYQLLNAIKRNHSTFTINNLKRWSFEEWSASPFSAFFLSLYAHLNWDRVRHPFFWSYIFTSIIHLFHFIHVQSRDQRHQTNSQIACVSKIHFMKRAWDFSFFIKFSAALQRSRFHYCPFRNLFGPSACTERASLELWKLG